MRKAPLTLVVCGLLDDINRERDVSGPGPSYGPNTYYMSFWQRASPSIRPEA